MTKPPSPYRAPAPGKKPHARATPDDDGLDEAAFRRQQKREEALETRGDELREQRETRTRTIGIVATVLFGACALLLAFVAPQPHRRNSWWNVLIGAGAGLGVMGYTLLAEVQRIRGHEQSPDQVRSGQVVGGVLGALFGVALVIWWH